MPRPGQTVLPAVLVLAVVGLLLGVAAEELSLRAGWPLFVPPFSLPLCLVVLAAALLTLGVRMRVQMVRKKRRVDPFFAVRLLAGSRAGQLVGGFFGAASLGMLGALLLRGIPEGASVWLPLVLSTVAGAVLLMCAYITEQLCRVPPNDGEEGGGTADDGGEAQLGYARE